MSLFIHFSNEVERQRHQFRELKTCITFFRVCSISPPLSRTRAATSDHALSTHRSTGSRRSRARMSSVLRLPPEPAVNNFGLLICDHPIGRPYARMLVRLVWFVWSMYAHLEGHQANPSRKISRLQRCSSTYTGCNSSNGPRGHFLRIASAKVSLALP